MTIEIQSLKDGKLILGKVSQTYALAEQAQLYDAINSACDQSATPVCSILDLASSTRFPPNILSTNLRDPHLPLKHRNFGISIIVTQSGFIRSIAAVGIKAGNLKTVRVTESLDAAMEMVDAFFAEHNVVNQ